MFERSCLRIPIATALAASCWWNARDGYAACSDGGQLSTCIDADTVLPSWGDSRLAWVPGTSVAAPRQLGVGLVATYLSGPITIIVPTASPTPHQVSAVDHVLDATMLAWMGLGAGFELGVALPFTGYRDGIGISSLTSEHSEPLPAFGLRDARLGATYAVVDGLHPFGELSAFRLAARFELSLPTGARQAFASNGGFVAIPTVTSSLEFGRVFVQGGVGARLRRTEDLLGTRVGPQGWVGLGGGVSFDEADAYQLAVEAFMLPTLASQRVSMPADVPGAGYRAEGSAGSWLPAEWLASFRMVVPTESRAISLIAGAGGPLRFGSEKTTLPELRLVAGVRYVPKEPVRAIDPPVGVSY